MPNIRYTRRTTINIAVLSPSYVIVSFHIWISVSPGVKNRLNTALIIIRITIDLSPLTMNLRGIFDIAITAASATVTNAYIHIFIPKNNDIINTTVPISFTLGSSL